MSDISDIAVALEVYSKKVGRGDAMKERRFNTPLLFTPLDIGKVRVKNRLVMAAMGLNWSNADGSITPRQLAYYVERAKGGIGLIITEGTSTDANARSANSSMLGIWNDSLVPGLRDLAKRIHAEGTPVFLQLHHGLMSSRRAPADISVQEVHRIIAAYVDGAVRAKSAGFDGVELHMVHRGTLSDFLSMRANRRQDEFGKTIEGRARASAEVVQGIKTKCGADFPVICRILAEEFLLGGNTPKQSTMIARLLEKAGADCISLSAGGRTSALEASITKTLPDEYSYWRAWPTREWPDATNAYFGEEFKKAVKIPIMMAGKIGSPGVAEGVLQEGKADMVALGRALLADPDFPRKAQEGRSGEIIRCLYDKYCRQLVRAGKPIDCIRWKAKRKREQQASAST